MFYAVKKGYKIGVFDNWPDAQTATAGFSSPDLKKFKTKEEAEAYLDDRDIWIERVSQDNKEGYLVAFTDGSYDEKLNRYSYGVALVPPNGLQNEICGYGCNKDYIESNNIIGEIFGVINAFDWAISNGFEKIKVYHDYEGLSKWLSGDWKAKSKVGQMYVRLFEAKFADFLEVKFVKVPGHCNIIYNDIADQLAKSALHEKQKVQIQGDHWFTIAYFSKEDFDVIVDLIEVPGSGISHDFIEKNDRYMYRFHLNKESVAVTLFKTGHKKLLVQGKNTYLFQVVISTVVELEENAKVEQILGSAYRVKIEEEKVDSAYTPFEYGLPSNYPNGIKRLIKQSIINLTHYIEGDDYTQYAFPALRALEGHIKYLITNAGGTAPRQFSGFNMDKTVSPYRYIYTASLTDMSKKTLIENCYNFYKANRDTLFHFGDILGSTDNTRFIQTKDEADEIIKSCLDLIQTQQ